MCREEYAHGFNPKPDPLGRALAAARRAVEIAPSNHLAYHALASALFLRREFSAFRSAAERAIALNPMDGFTMAYLGSLVAYSGDWERGRGMAKQARDMNPHHPAWYWFSDCFDAYRRGDYREARDIARKIQMPGFWRMNLALAATHGQLGERDAAAGALRELLAAKPEFASRARDELSKWWNPDLVEQLMDGLDKAGLDRRSRRSRRRPYRHPEPPQQRPPGGGGGGPPRLPQPSSWPRPHGSGARVRASTSKLDTASTPAAIRSIAVLPLDNYSGDPSQDYFAEGMTDELTSDLANISQLRVISRGSVMQFKGAHRPPTPEIARILNVDAIVEGSVLRSGDKVRITAQLIDARSDRHLWSKSFERNSRDVLALQDELASAIAREIHVRLTPEEQSRLTRAASVNPEAYDAYLKGRYFFNRPSDENLSKAIAQFEEAIRLDPKFAPAYSGLSDAYLWAGYNEGVLANAEAGPKSKAAAQEAIRLDDASAEAHASLATYLGGTRTTGRDPRREYRRSFALNPNYSFAHDQFGILLALQGRLDESVAEGKRASELDPLSPADSRRRSHGVCLAGQFPGGEGSREEGGESRSDLLLSSVHGGVDGNPGGQVKDAIPLFQKAVAVGSPPFVAAWLGYAYGVTGDRARATAALDDLKKTSLKGYIPPFNLAHRPSRPRRPRARPRLPRTGLRQQLPVDALPPGRQDLGSPPLRPPLRRPDEKTRLPQVSNRAAARSATCEGRRTSEVHLRRERLEPRVRRAGPEEKGALDSVDGPGALFVGLLQPVHRGVLLAETGVDVREMVRRDVRSSSRGPRRFRRIRAHRPRAGPPSRTPAPSCDWYMVLVGRQRDRALERREPFPWSTRAACSPSRAVAVRPREARLEPTTAPRPRRGPPGIVPARRNSSAEIRSGAPADRAPARA